MLLNFPSKTFVTQFRPAIAMATLNNPTNLHHLTLTLAYTKQNMLTVTEVVKNAVVAG